MVIDEQIHATADRLLLAGVQPTSNLIAESLGVASAQVEEALSKWWGLVPERLSISDSSIVVPDVPDALNQAFSRVWQQAVQEASSQFVEDKYRQEVGIDVVRREADETLQESRDKQIELEDKLRAQVVQNEEVFSQIRGLEAEIEVLKNNLVSETGQRKQEEQAKHNLQQELNHLRKTYEDSKRTFDQRIKDEQRHTLEAVSKADADVRYYRGALEKLRDEVGKKEAALTKSIHELQAELARKDAKNDTQNTQIKSLEDELKRIKQDTSGQHRDLAKLNSSLLSESNKNKRLDDKIKELEEEVRKARQKQVSLSNEQSRRESNVRQQYKDKEEELVRALARVASLEKKIIAQDEEVRRLNARI